MIDFNQLAQNLNIPILRRPKMTAWLNILVSGLKEIQAWWMSRLNGSAYTIWNNTTNYILDAKVRYGRANYVVVNTAPAGLHPLPTNRTYWYKFTDDYIGITERSSYSGIKVMLEYALNRRFSPTTITPPFGPTIPSIYIQNNHYPFNILYSAPGNVNTNTWTAPISSNNFWFCPLGNPVFNSTNFTVWVPTAIMTAISTTFSEAQFIVIQEVNRYRLAGLVFDVQQY